MISTFSTHGRLVSKYNFINSTSDHKCFFRVSTVMSSPGYFKLCTYSLNTLHVNPPKYAKWFSCWEVCEWALKYLMRNWKSWNGDRISQNYVGCLAREYREMNMEDASQTPTQRFLKPAQSQYKKGKRTDGVKVIFIKMPIIVLEESLASMLSFPFFSFFYLLLASNNYCLWKKFQIIIYNPLLS